MNIEYANGIKQTEETTNAIQTESYSLEPNIHFPRE